MIGAVLFLAAIAACIAILYKLGVNFDRKTTDVYNLPNGKTQTVTRKISFHFGKRH